MRVSWPVGAALWALLCLQAGPAGAAVLKRCADIDFFDCPEDRDLLEVSLTLQNVRVLFAGSWVHRLDLPPTRPLLLHLDLDRLPDRSARSLPYQDWSRALYCEEGRPFCLYGFDVSFSFSFGTDGSGRVLDNWRVVGFDDGGPSGRMYEHLRDGSVLSVGGSVIGVSIPLPAPGLLLPCVLACAAGWSALRRRAARGCGARLSHRPACRR